MTNLAVPLGKKLPREKQHTSGDYLLKISENCERHLTGRKFQEFIWALAVITRYCKLGNCRNKNCGHFGRRGRPKASSHNKRDAQGDGVSSWKAVASLDFAVA